MSQEPLSDADYELLDRFFAGETSAAENPTVRALLARWPEVGERVQAIVRGVRGLMPDVPEVGRSWEMVVGDGLAERVRGQRGRGAGAEVPQEESASPVLRGIGGLGTQPLRWGVWYAVATSTIIVVLALSIFSHRHSPTGEHAMISYVTARGERATIILPDSTRVTLNVASRIDVPRDFGEGNRLVRLSGEADFQVTHTAGTPLTVEAAGRPISVLGTEFGVRAYQPNDGQVAVRSGKIAVDHDVLTAQDIGQWSATRTVLVAHHQPLDAAFGFMMGQLILRDRPVQEAIGDLNRWYDVDLRLGDPSLGLVRFNAVLASGSIAHLMVVLENTLDVRVVRDGRTLTLYPR